MPRIFISYRRDDSTSVSLRLYGTLLEHYGPEAVFIDTDSIPPGIDFSEYIHWQINSADVVLVVVGRDWLDCRFGDGIKVGSRRLEDPSDFVRTEIRLALNRQIPVVPLLLEGVRMPGEDELPDDIAKFAKCNAHALRSGRHLKTSVMKLVERLTFLFSLPSAPPREFVNSLGVRFVYVHPGAFMMGALDGNRNLIEGVEDEPLHHVEITTPFYMSSFLTTQEQYFRIMNANPSQFRGDPRLPVDSVSWDDAVTFCERLSAQREELAAQRSYRLPTEEEWEFCCRAGRPPVPANSPSEGNCNTENTTIVGSYPPNPWSLYDMLGNLFEWCLEPAFEEFRPIKGGCFRGTSRCSLRNSARRAEANRYVGFRVLCTSSWRRPGIPL
ncbi:MAG TPA: SUMF1/EgtB/PvdO family nonheme iron enzyme [Longimicrobium sp.]|nr:SUMF1/EgtB/PvdO family nonheme iron enzyme [Longimicrobium sp.]